MRLILILTLILTSLPSQAGILGYLLAAAAGSASQSKVAAPKTELEILISSIEEKVPGKCTGSIYSQCWNQYSKESISFYTPPGKTEEIYTYFINKGYKVTRAASQITFDFTPEHKNFLLHQKVPLSLETGIMLLPFLGLITLVLLGRSKYRRKIKVVQAAYSQMDTKDLIFHSPRAQEELEESLSRNTLPLGWFVLVKDNKIVRITKSSSYRVELVASHIDSYLKMFKRVLPKSSN